MRCRLVRRVAPVLACLTLSVAAAPAQAVTARAAQAACPAASAQPSTATADQLERATLCLVNLERSERGLPRLNASGKLRTAAANHSRDMVTRGYFGHASPGGSQVLDRIKAVGYLTGGRSYAFAENLAWGSGSLAAPLKIVRSWMGSPSHRVNILNRRLEEIGVGVALGTPSRSGSGATYTTAFGAKS